MGVIYERELFKWCPHSLPSFSVFLSSNSSFHLAPQPPKHPNSAELGRRKSQSSECLDFLFFFPPPPSSAVNFRQQATLRHQTREGQSHCCTKKSPGTCCEGLSCWAVLMTHSALKFALLLNLVSSWVTLTLRTQKNLLHIRLFLILLWSTVQAATSFEAQFSQVLEFMVLPSLSTMSKLMHQCLLIEPFLSLSVKNMLLPLRLFF